MSKKARRQRKRAPRGQQVQKPPRRDELTEVASALAELPDETLQAIEAHRRIAARNRGVVAAISTLTVMDMITNDPLVALVTHFQRIIASSERQLA